MMGVQTEGTVQKTRVNVAIYSQLNTATSTLNIVRTLYEYG